MFDLIKLPRLLFPTQTEDTVNKSFPYDNKEGIVAETIYPDRKGCVSSNGIYWTARCADNIVLEPGDVVFIERLDNITAWVKRISERN